MSLRKLPPRQAEGAFIGLVGPDGSGKTTVASELELQCASLHRAFSYIHWRPSLTAPFRPPSPDATPVPKNPVRDDVSLLGRMVSLARLLRNVIAFNVAYVTRIRPRLKSGGVIVVDRWIYNYMLQPHTVRYYGSPRVAEFVCCRLVVQPQPVFVLNAPARVILARSNELSETQVDSEYERLHVGLRLSDVRWIDATSTPADIAANILSQCGLTERQAD